MNFPFRGGRYITEWEGGKKKQDVYEAKGEGEDDD